MDSGGHPACVSYTSTISEGLAARSVSSWYFGVCSPMLWAVFTQPGCAVAPGWVTWEEQVRCPLLSDPGSEPVCFHAPLRRDHPVQSRCKPGWPAQQCCGQTGEVGVPRLGPVCHPGVCVQRWCSDPSPPCAVAVEIACTVARQLKHPRLHTAMPRNSQLSSFLSPGFDFAEMTPLALIPLHSVALLRFLSVNPIKPEKPTRHCE